MARAREPPASTPLAASRDARRWGEDPAAPPREVPESCPASPGLSHASTALNDSSQIGRVILAGSYWWALSTSAGVGRAGRKTFDNPGEEGPLDHHSGRAAAAAGRG